MEKNKQTVFNEYVLTHRTDLKERVVPRSLPGDYDKNSGRTIISPTRSIKGKLVAVEPTKHLPIVTANLRIDHPKHGEVVVHTNMPNLGKEGDKAFQFLQQQLVGRDVTASLDKTGTALNIAADSGLGIKISPRSPATPYVLVPLETSSFLQGRLQAVHANGRCVEIVEKGKPVLLQGTVAGSSETTLRKMVGETVSATVDKAGKLTVVSLEKKKQLSR